MRRFLNQVYVNLAATLVVDLQGLRSLRVFLTLMVRVFITRRRYEMKYERNMRRVIREFVCTRRRNFSEGQKLPDQPENSRAQSGFVTCALHVVIEKTIIQILPNRV